MYHGDGNAVGMRSPFTRTVGTGWGWGATLCGWSENGDRNKGKDASLPTFEDFYAYAKIKHVQIRAYFS